MATDSTASGIQTIQAADTGEMKRKGKEQKPGISLQSHLGHQGCQLILRTWNKEEKSCNFTDTTSPFIKFRSKKIDHIVPLVQAFYFIDERMQLRNGCDMVTASSWQNQDKKPSLLIPNPGLSPIIFCSLTAWLPHHGFHTLGSLYINILLHRGEGHIKDLCGRLSCRWLFMGFPSVYRGSTSKGPLSLLQQAKLESWSV